MYYVRSFYYRRARPSNVTFRNSEPKRTFNMYFAHVYSFPLFLIALFAGKLHVLFVAYMYNTRGLRFDYCPLYMFEGGQVGRWY